MNVSQRAAARSGGPAVGAELSVSGNVSAEKTNSFLWAAWKLKPETEVQTPST